MTPGAFKLPAEITTERETLPAGIAYAFRHRTLGLLGRIRAQERPVGGSHLTCEVAGDPADPATARRAAIFEPISRDIAAHFAPMPDVDQHREVPPPVPADPGYWLRSELIQCKTCGAPVAFLTFAADASDPARIEDYARQLYSTLAHWNVPAWIVGPVQRSSTDESEVADVAPVWPVRGSMARMTRRAFDAMLDELENGHCQPSKWRLVTPM